jgi:hypothetical protein
MVAQTQADVPVGAVVPNRGFIPEETVVATGPGNALVTYYRPFWRPVLAGTLFALSVFALSWFLMLGCHVGITSSGLIALGGGAAVWLWVTACVAYFFGGMIAGAMTGSAGGGTTLSSGSAWLKGAVIWGLSIPLALVLYAFVAQSGVLTTLGLPAGAAITERATPPAAGMGAHYGFYWSTFICLALALIASIIGSMAGGACRKAQCD